jgi:predicted Zn-dependent protease
MKIQLISAAVLSVVCLAHSAVQAADTPSNMPSPAPVAAVDALDPARESIKKSQWSNARSQLQALLPKMAGNADLHNLLGYVHRKQAQPDLDKAIEHYNKALSIDPSHRGAHEYIGEAWLQQKQPDKARQHLETLRRLCGGTSCEEYQDLAQAIAAYTASKPQ